MNESSQYCEQSDIDVCSHHSSSWEYSDLPESSTMSDAGIEKGRSYNESEIMLASSHPKKPNGRKKFKETRHPVYRGVRKRNSNRWVCEVREPNKKNRIWLGTYPTAEMAARAHDVAAIALRGMKSCLNFADSAWRLPVPASSEQEDIQRAAAEAAEMFRPEEYDEENINMDKTTITIDEDASSGSNTNVTNYQAYNGDSFSIMNETNWYTQPQPQPQPHPQQESSYYSMQHPQQPQPQPQPQPQQESSYYFDEEAIFDMPGLLHSMAEGLLLPPPSFMDSDQATCENAENNDNYVNLWNTDPSGRGSNSF